VLINFKTDHYGSNTFIIHICQIFSQTSIHQFMSVELIINNILNPPILFFFLGLLAVFIKSDLDIPQPVSRFLSIYLLFSIGLKGGVELAHSSFNREVVTSLAAAIFMASVVPAYSFFILKKRLNVFDAGAVAATYGSISAVTFITAAAYLAEINVPYGGHMVAAMALMESPAIIIGVALIRRYDRTSEEKNGLGPVIKESLTNGSVFLILGALVVGFLSGPASIDGIAPFTEGLFKGMLTLFLLDMGLLAGKRIYALRKAGAFAILFAVLMPLFNACLAIVIAWLLGLSKGNALLFTVLCASASYIAVPAAIRLAVPQANAGLYVPMSLAITFPLNIVVGIPLYYYFINLVL
jgi:hypothetical protein